MSPFQKLPEFLHGIQIIQLKTEELNRDIQHQIETRGSQRKGIIVNSSCELIKIMTEIESDTLIQWAAITQKAKMEKLKILRA